MYNNVRKTKKEVKNFIDKISSIDNKNFHIINRYREPDKDPGNILSKLEYDYYDLIKEAKSLDVSDFLRCIIDTKNEFFLMYCFIKII